MGTSGPMGPNLLCRIADGALLSGVSTLLHPGHHFVAKSPRSASNLRVSGEGTYLELLQY